jgi:hypothetical protein
MVSLPFSFKYSLFSLLPFLYFSPEGHCLIIFLFRGEEGGDLFQYINPCTSLAGELPGAAGERAGEEGGVRLQAGVLALPQVHHPPLRPVVRCSGNVLTGQKERLEELK